VPFAGYSLPVQFPDGVLKSHLHTRSPGCASLFDVGHMGQLKWFGKDRAAFLERVCLADVHGLAPGASTLTLITLPSGGILDDSILSNHSEWGYQCVGIFALRKRGGGRLESQGRVLAQPFELRPPPSPLPVAPPRPPLRPLIRTPIVPPPHTHTLQLHGGQRRHKGKGHGPL
jgi:hypothetical protein